MITIIHRFKQNGYNIVLDVNSGAVHVMDELSYDLLDKIEPPLSKECPDVLMNQFSSTYSREEILSAYDDLYDLYKEGQLFSEDDYDRFSSLMSVSPIKAMCLHIAHDCNLRCEYCFASTGEYGGKRSLMSLEVGKRAIDYLLYYSAGRRNLEVDFFGGEPLMNFQVIKDIITYAREREKVYNKNFRFTTTTNGVLLDDAKIEYLNREMSNVVLSLDGRPEVNDRMRRRLDSSGSYAGILPKFQKFVKVRGDGQYYVRGTYTAYNLDFVEDVLHFESLGFDQISVEPVVTEASNPYAITEKHLPIIYAEYDRLAKLMADRIQNGEKRFNFFHFMMDLDQGPCAIKRLRGCGCGNEYVAVTPTGEVYPCHQFVGHEEWKMGNVFDRSLDMNLKERFAKSTVYGKEDCRNCWAKFYCSGGCNANGMLYRGDILKPHTLSCELERKRVECSLMLKAVEASQ